MAHKNEAIMDAARRVFGRDGYARSSIEVIAAEAGVSTRTIYNHFESKEQLFSEVLRASGARVANAFVEAVARAFASETDRDRLLQALGQALAAQRSDFPEHFAVVRQINAEAPHFPPAVIEAWQEAGPLRVEREVERRLRQLVDQGAVRVDDPVRATLHFIALTTAETMTRSYAGAAPLTEHQTAEMVATGVRTFLYGYGTKAGERGDSCDIWIPSEVSTEPT